MNEPVAECAEGAESPLLKRAVDEWTVLLPSLACLLRLLQRWLLAWQPRQAAAARPHSTDLRPLSLKRDCGRKSAPPLHDGRDGGGSSAEAGGEQALGLCARRVQDVSIGLACASLATLGSGRAVRSACVVNLARAKRARRWALSRAPWFARRLAFAPDVRWCVHVVIFALHDAPVVLL